MEQQYSGMCIGGPEDGKFMVGYAPYWEVAVMPRPMLVPWEPLDIAEIPKPTFHKVIYKHRHFAEEAREWNFWVDSTKSAWTLTQILHHIMNNYSAPEAEKK